MFYGTSTQDRSQQRVQWRHIPPLETGVEIAVGSLLDDSPFDADDDDEELSVIADLVSWTLIWFAELSEFKSTLTVDFDSVVQLFTAVFPSIPIDMDGAVDSWLYIVSVQSATELLASLKCKNKTASNNRQK